MIIPLYATSVNQVATRLVELRAQSGVAALARHQTLLIECPAADTENSIQIARAATMGHPGRVVVVTAQAPDAHPALDAQIRVGSDAGSGEVIVLRLVGHAAGHLDAVVSPLLLPDTPVVVWWPSQRPEVPATSALGALASKRITDAREAADVAAALEQLSAGYTTGDTDLCWARLSPWRAMLAAALKGTTLPGPVTSAMVSGPVGVAAELMATWIGFVLRVPVRREVDFSGALSAVELNFSGGGRLLLDKEHTQAGVMLRLTGHPDRHLVLSRRSTPDCLAEELRCLGSDQVYGQLVTEALPAQATRPKGGL